MFVYSHYLAGYNSHSLVNCDIIETDGTYYNIKPFHLLPFKVHQSPSSNSRNYHLSGEDQSPVRLRARILCMETYSVPRVYHTNEPIKFPEILADAKRLQAGLSLQF